MSLQPLQISFLPDINHPIRLGEVSLLLDKHEKNRIHISPWSDDLDQPKVLFSIAHNNDHLFIKYDVVEREVLARYRKINDPVYKDSCVEFFIAFDDDKTYYNIEFNRLGTCLGRFGGERENRTELAVDLLKTITYERTLRQTKNNAEPAINWTLTVAVPIQVFGFHHFDSIQGQKAKMNFFKCGDDLTQPHYLAWSNIVWPHPNFHLPQFFSPVEFM